MRVKYLAQKHNAVPRPGLEPGSPDPESSALGASLKLLLKLNGQLLLGQEHVCMRVLHVTEVIVLGTVPMFIPQFKLADCHLEYESKTAGHLFILSAQETSSSLGFSLH